MTTDRKNFESHEFRAIIMAVKYPGVAYRLGTWFGSIGGVSQAPKSKTAEPVGTLTLEGFSPLVRPGQKTGLTT